MVLLTGTEIICVKFQVHILAGSGDIKLEEGPYQALYEDGHGRNNALFVNYHNKKRSHSADFIPVIENDSTLFDFIHVE